MRGEGVAEGVTVDAFRNFGLARGGGDGFLEGIFVAVMAAGDAGARILREGGRGEDPLPGPLTFGGGVFAGVGFGEIDLAVSGGEILGVEGADLREMGVQAGTQAVREHGEAIFVSFATADDDLPSVEVNIFDPESDAFHEPQSAAVEEFCHQSVNAAHGGENGVRFRGREDDGEAAGAMGGVQVAEVAKRLAEGIAVEEDEGIEGEIVGGGGDLEFHCQEVEERADAIGSGVLRFGPVWKAFVQKAEVSLRPSEVCFFGTEGVAPLAEDKSHVCQAVGAGSLLEKAIEEPEGLFGLSDGVFVGSYLPKVVAEGTQMVRLQSGGRHVRRELGAALPPFEGSGALLGIQVLCLEKVREGFPGRDLTADKRFVNVCICFVFHGVYYT